MQRFVKLLAFACCVITAAAKCTSSKYNRGTKDWLRCSESSIAEVKTNLQNNLIALSVSQSVIPEIPDLYFTQNGTTLEIMHFHECGISQIGNGAFRGLILLKRLSLSYNNITNLSATWFYDLPSLEQLDLSFNRISILDSSIYFQLRNLRRWDLNDNQLKCIPTENMESMKQLKNIRIQGNPLSYLCRAQLMLFLNDHQVSYATSDDKFIWLDGILCQCLLDVPTTLGISPEADQRMNTCVISNMFNQLTTVLGASPSVESSTKECSPFRQSLTQCLRDHNIKTNGDMLMNFLALTHNAMPTNAD